MRLLLHAIAAGVQRSIAWISLQPDGSISVGLIDRVFVSPHFRARNFVWNLYNRVTVQYLVLHSPETLRPVMNPHVTFHPPNYFHLRANGEEELFAGIAEPRLVLHDDECVPWIRFVSKPAVEIGEANPPRDPAMTTVECVALPDENSSVGLGIDFVRPAAVETQGFLLSRCIDWSGHRIHVFVEARPPQIATLAWYHQS